MLLKSDSLSDIGRHRKRNEDASYHNPESGLFIIADGMGGHLAGDVASQLTVESLREQLERQTADKDPAQIPQRLKRALEQTNQTVLRAGQNNPNWAKMGSTAAILLLQQGRAFIANIGDSRIYLLHAGNLRQCSIDHNPSAASWLDGRILNRSNILTQAIGLEQPLDIFQQTFSVCKGDRILLCTDGLNNMLADAEIKHLLLSAKMPAEACQQLVATANASGGYDNISVIIVDIIEP